MDSPSGWAFATYIGDPVSSWILALTWSNSGCVNLGSESVFPSLFVTFSYKLINLFKKGREGTKRKEKL